MHGGGLYKIFIIIAAISLLMDWYVFSGLRTFTADWRSGLWRRVVLYGYLVISIGVTAIFLLGTGSFSTARGMTPYHEYMLSLFLTFFITKLFFIVVLSLGDLGRFIVGIVNYFQKHKTKGKGYFPARRKFISEIAILVSAIPFSGLLYAMIKGKYDYRVHRETAYYEDLPEAFDGFTITQISDIHSGSFDDMDAVKRGIDLAQSQHSDLFVFTGDLVNNAAWEIEKFIPHFSTLRAPYGQFSILGNHDYGDYIQWSSEADKAANLDKLKEHHKDLGYRLLLDENVEIEKDGHKISLIGVQNWGKGFIQMGDLDKAMQGVDKNAFKILLSHDPTHWEEKVRHYDTDIHLTLSGLTHGAQVGVETAGFRWSPVQYRYLDWAGWAHQGNRYLYVNRGFGFLAFSGRLGIWPEITVITLKKGKA